MSERLFWINKTTEECAEVIQALAKVLNYGEYKVDPRNGINNKYHLETELGELKYCIDQLVEVLELSEPNMYNAYLEKERKIYQYAGDSVILSPHSHLINDCIHETIGVPREECLCDKCTTYLLDQINDRKQQKEISSSMRMQKYNDDEFDMDGRC